MNRNTHALRSLAIIVAALTYASAVVYGDIMFLQIVQSAFPKGSILETLAYVGALVTAVTALTLPIALHYWFAPGLQFILGIVFWLVDIFVLCANSILAYQVSMGHVDDLMRAWQQLAPATPMLAVFGWGIIFLLDPSHLLRHAQAELEADQIEIFANRLRAAARSAEVDGEISAGARAVAREYAYRLTQQPAGTPPAPHQAPEPEPAVPPKPQRIVDQLQAGLSNLVGGGNGHTPDPTSGPKKP